MDFVSVSLVNNLMPSHVNHYYIGIVKVFKKDPTVLLKMTIFIHTLYTKSILHECSCIIEFIKLVEEKDRK